MREDIDWAAVQAEYIQGNIGQEKLAAAHGIAYKTLRSRAVRDGWAAQRAEYRQKLGEKLPEALLEERLKKIDRAADRLMEKLTRAVNQLDRHPVVIREKGRTRQGNEYFKQRVVYERNAQIDRQGLKTLAAALKELQGVIRAGQQDGGGEITVRFEGAEDFGS